LGARRPWAPPGKTTSENARPAHRLLSKDSGFFTEYVGEAERRTAEGTKVKRPSFEQVFESHFDDIYGYVAFRVADRQALLRPARAP